jgi:hypothetical protein
MRTSPGGAVHLVTPGPPCCVHVMWNSSSALPHFVSGLLADQSHLWYRWDMRLQKANSADTNGMFQRQNVAAVRNVRGRAANWRSVQRNETIPIPRCPSTLVSRIINRLSGASCRLPRGSSTATHQQRVTWRSLARYGSPRSERAAAAFLRDIRSTTSYDRESRLVSEPATNVQNGVVRSGRSTCSTASSAGSLARATLRALLSS